MYVKKMFQSSYDLIIQAKTSNVLIQETSNPRNVTTQNKQSSLKVLFLMKE